MSDLHWFVPWAPPVAPGLPVTEIVDDGYVVRGTTDPIEAMRAVVAHKGYAEGRDGEDRWPPPVHRIGWFRWNPCNERSCYDGGGHGGHLDYADGRGRGRWQAVYLAYPV